VSNPSVPQALRLQALLINGVARIHCKQAGYLEDDCQDALVSAATVCNGPRRINGMAPYHTIFLG
jgi:hypothetical protein